MFNMSNFLGAIMLHFVHVYVEEVSLGFGISIRKSPPPSRWKSHP